MPTYQYQCDACDYAFEILQSMLDKKLKKCPECSKNRLHRLIGAGSGIIFKGSGFYETDYKKKEPSKSTSSGNGSNTSAKVSKPEGDKNTPASKKETKSKTGQVA